MMLHDVFISYSDKDRLIVSGLCAYLEQKGLRCFVAYRDIPQGVVWAGAITEAIENCKIMVAVFSENFNNSEQVDREIELCSAERKPILVFRLTDIPYSKVKKYYLKNIHWIDAFPRPEAFFSSVYDSVRRLIREDDQTIPPAALHPLPEVKSWKMPDLLRYKKPMLWILTLIVIAVGVMASLSYFKVFKTRIPDIQPLVENAVMQVGMADSAVSGIVIVMDVKTGVVLDLVDLTYEINTGSNPDINGYGNNSPVNIKHCLEMPYKDVFFALKHFGLPFTPISVLASLDEKKINLQDSIELDSGLMIYRGRTMTDGYFQRDSCNKVAVNQLLMKHSYIGITKLVIRSFDDSGWKFLKALKRMSVGEPFHERQMADTDTAYHLLAWAAIGYGLALSPIQLLAAYNAIANDGSMVAPVFSSFFERPVLINDRIASDESIRNIRGMLKQVSLNDGEGHTSVAGMSCCTMVDAFYPVPPDYKFTSFFGGYFPVDQPRYSCLVLVNINQECSQIAYAIANRLAENILLQERGHK